MKKNKIKGLVIKSFITIAVVMMITSVVPSEGSQINEKSKNNRKVICCYKLRIGS